MYLKMRNPKRLWMLGFPLICLTVIAYFSLTFNQKNVIPSKFLGKFSSSDIYVTDTVRYSTSSTEIQVENENRLSELETGNMTLLNRAFFQYLIRLLKDTPYPGVENYVQYISATFKKKAIPDARPLRPDFGQIINDVTSSKYPIDNLGSCDVKNNSSPSLLVAIQSAPGYFEKRDAIRQTWIDNLKNQSKTEPTVNFIGYIFVIGIPRDEDIQIKIKNESEIFGDILQIDLIDDYYNLTLKAVGLLNWVYSHCSHVDLVLKVDDDIYVNGRNLLAVTKSLNTTQPTIYGFFSNSVPHRAGTWKISRKDWPWSSYPTYLRGASLLIPGNTIGSLLAAAQTIPHVPFDDVYLTGLCAEKANIRVRHADRFLIGGASKIPEPCHVYKSVTWLTDTVNHLYRSHRATEDFYSSYTRCVDGVDATGLNRTVNSSEIFPFTFLLLIR